MRAAPLLLLALSLSACALSDEAAPASTASEAPKQAQPLPEQVGELSSAKAGPSAAPAAPEPALDAPPPPPRPKPSKRRARPRRELIEKSKAQAEQPAPLDDAFAQTDVADVRAELDDGKAVDRVVVVDGLDEDAEEPADLPAPEPEEVTEEEPREPRAPKTGLALADEEDADRPVEIPLAKAKAEAKEGVVTGEAVGLDDVGALENMFGARVGDRGREQPKTGLSMRSTSAWPAEPRRRGGGASDLSMLKRQARVVMHYQDGEPAGIKALGVRPGSSLDRLGVQAGDILLRADGVRLTAPNRWVEIDGRLGAGPPPVLEVERRGERIVLYPDAAVDDDAWAGEPKPARFLPRVGYFENTYLGRSPEYLRQVRRLDAQFPGRAPYQAAVLPDQPLDAPKDAGLALTATLDRPSLEQPHRVFLQVALKGSDRFGWRRPPLDLTLVIDAQLAANEPETVTQAVTGLLRRLDPRDRLGVVVAQPEGPAVLSPVTELREARRTLTRTLVDGVNFKATGNPLILAGAVDRAGALLRDAAQGQARVPGSQTVIVLTRGGDRRRVQAAAAVAHRLTLQGAVTSVIDLADSGDLWWQVAQAGHGHDHRGRALGEALDAELASLSKVIARLLRINVRLAPDVRAVRILGSRMLSEIEKTRVKAREVATDRQISKTLGVKADRGDDDDGLQVVIPYFYGGDAHVVLIELWVDKPGAVAEVTLKYKDMVQLTNATARASAKLAALPAPLTAAHRAVRDNVRGFEFAQVLAKTASLARRGLLNDARRTLRTAQPATYDDKVVVQRFTQAFNRHPQDRLADALKLASRRRIAQGGL